MSAQQSMNRWWVVVGAVLIQLCPGAIYAWSVFTPALLAAGWSKLDTRVVFAPHLDEAHRPFSVHGFLHQAHLFEARRDEPVPMPD